MHLPSDSLSLMNSKPDSSLHLSTIRALKCNGRKGKQEICVECNVMFTETLKSMSCMHTREHIFPPSRESLDAWMQMFARTAFAYHKGKQTVEILLWASHRKDNLHCVTTFGIVIVVSRRSSRESRFDNSLRTAHNGERLPLLASLSLGSSYPI